MSEVLLLVQRQVTKTRRVKDLSLKRAVNLPQAFVCNYRGIHFGSLAIAGVTRIYGGQHDNGICGKRRIVISIITVRRSFLLVSFDVVQTGR